MLFFFLTDFWKLANSNADGAVAGEEHLELSPGLLRSLTVEIIQELCVISESQQATRWLKDFFYYLLGKWCCIVSLREANTHTRWNAQNIWNRGPDLQPPHFMIVCSAAIGKEPSIRASSSCLLLVRKCAVSSLYSIRYSLLDINTNPAAWPFMTRTNTQSRLNRSTNLLTGLCSLFVFRFAALLCSGKHIGVGEIHPQIIFHFWLE